ncbi:MAG TPA: aspartate ammonia-lyase [Bdellovibrionales bacterium]|nr:aspartate ammonia-lyase [Bdellovibrionales bacterium]HCM41524.1 aspartate ammonia-lyase [Bdellovibrionales bacterium]
MLDWAWFLAEIFMKKSRIEKDTLGTIQIPAHAWYGAQTARAIANFSVSGRAADETLIRAFLRIKKAAAEANRRCGVLDQSRTKSITRAIDQILHLPPDRWKELFPVDIYQAGAGTSQNMNINEVIANFANHLAGKPKGSNSPVHPNDHVNRSQSTNDTFPAAMRLALLEASAPLFQELQKLGKTFARKARGWHKIPKSARTHLQDAVPMRAGQELSGYAMSIEKCADWLQEGRRNLLVLGISGSAAGTGLTVPAGYGTLMIRSLRAQTGEPVSLSDNLFYSMQSQAPVLLYSSMLRLCAVEITRICNDLRLLASGPLTGLGELLLPAVQPGSSIMPGKVNPSVLEMCNQAFFSVIGLDQTSMLACQAGQLELNVMMPIMAHSLIDATHIASRSLGILRTHAIEGMRPNTGRMLRYFESTPQIATVLSPKLGYEITAKLVQEALAEGISILELVRRHQLVGEKELRELTRLENLAGR